MGVAGLPGDILLCDNACNCAPVIVLVAFRTVMCCADCVFVHASGFIGGNLTRDGVLEMARRALKED